MACPSAESGFESRNTIGPKSSLRRYIALRFARSQAGKRE